jgi:hypothetical protein
VIDAADFIVPLVGAEVAAFPGQCISGIQDGGNGESDGALVLGDVWLKSVLAVFDVGNRDEGCGKSECCMNKFLGTFRRTTSYLWTHTCRARH